MSEIGNGLLSDKPSLESVQKRNELPLLNNFDFDYLKQEIKELSRHITKTKRGIQKEFIRFRMVMVFFFVVTMFLPLFDMIDINNIKNGLYSFSGAFLISYVFEVSFIWLSLLKLNRDLNKLSHHLTIPETYYNLSKELKHIGNELALYPDNIELQRQFNILDKKLKYLDKKVESINYKNK